MYSAFLVLSVSAKLLLARRFGIEGIVWAGVVIYPLTVLLPLRATLNKTLKRIAANDKYSRGAVTLESTRPE